MAEGVRIFERGGEYTALKGGGRGLTAQISQIQAAQQQRPDLFIGGKSNVSRTQLAAGYSLTGGAGKQLVDTISYRGTESSGGGTFNVYKDAAANDGDGDDDDDVGNGDDDGGNGDDGGDDDDGGENNEINYGDLINQTLASIPSISDITSAITNANKASEERIAAMNKENRKLMLIDARNRRSEDRTPNLQIRGAGETPRTAGSQGFRRRTDQFKIAPFQGISGNLGAVSQVMPQNKLVNI